MAGERPLTVMDGGGGGSGGSGGDGDEDRGDRDDFTDSSHQVIGRRALAEIRENEVVNLGVGLPEAVASAAAETGRMSEFALTVEGECYADCRALVWARGDDEPCRGADEPSLDDIPHPTCHPS